MKILICDDDPTCRDFLDKMLVTMGFEPIVLSDGIDAVLKLSSPGAPKIAILDWVMPHITGPEICKKVREHSSLLAVHLILLTTKDSPENIAEGLAMGASDYVTKPFNPIELRARLELGKKIVSLQDEVRALSGLLSMCTCCKRVRTRKREWMRLEEYVQDHNTADAKNDVCPECQDKLPKLRMAKKIALKRFHPSLR